MSKNVLPQFLKKGDKAVIISPSGSIENKYICGAKSRLESWGLNVEVATHALNQNGRFCGTIDERLYDIQTAMNDSEAKLILCSRGGYGIVHLIDRLNFDKIKQQPKWMVGYSDITALHQAFLQNNIISLHAPMAKHLTEEGEDDKASIFLQKTLFGEIPQYEIDSHPMNIDGRAEGILFGGNLAMLCSLMGSEYSKFPENGILFIEDTGEQAYQIDRMMWTLKITGVLSKIKGLIVGGFSDCAEDTLMYAPIYESIRNVVEDYNIPIAFQFPVGHSKNNYPLLHGRRLCLRVEKEKTILATSTFLS